MFGYVRPVKERLEEGMFEQYHSIYCGLCASMRSRCGFISGFFLNYDFAFLAMLLSGEETSECKERRCAAHPIKKVRCIYNCPAIDFSADCSVILAYWKLKDSCIDNKGLKKFGYYLLSVLLKHAYNKARIRRPEFAVHVEERITRLNELEREHCPSIDKAADTFASILSAAVPEHRELTEKRILQQVLYHTGRAVYIMDAVDDYADDLKSGDYNPVRYRFPDEGTVLTRETIDELDRTIRHSINIAASSYELLDRTKWSGILENIIYLGLPASGAKALKKAAGIDEKDTQQG